MSAAAAAAAALRTALADTSKLARPTVAFGDARPRWVHICTWAELPGLTKIISGSTRARTAEPVAVFMHELLPGWEYAPHELEEMAGDLEALAAGKGQPTHPTRNPPRAGDCPAQGKLL